MEQAIVLLKTTGLFVVTALAEIVGCFLPYLWLRKGGPIWLLVPAAASLALFVWLLTLHPTASGRVYAAYGGVYVATALAWLRIVDGVKLSALDWIGAGIALLGMSIIVVGWLRRLSACLGTATPEGVAGQVDVFPAKPAYPSRIFTSGKCIQTM
jgi:small multidrug resistance family-3 protein